MPLHNSYQKGGFISNIFSAVLDSIDCHIAVIDKNGYIQYVNNAWKNFAIDNGMKGEVDWLSCNYLHVCNQAAETGDEHAAAVIAGLSMVIDDQKKPFFMNTHVMVLKKIVGTCFTLFLSKAMINNMLSLIKILLEISY